MPKLVSESHSLYMVEFGEKLIISEYMKVSITRSA